MRILSKKAIRDASSSHPEWKASLENWYRITQNADWKNFADVRQTFNRASQVGKFIVFDVAHNKCRLISTVNYKWSMVYVRDILSHAAYDQKKWEHQ